MLEEEMLMTAPAKTEQTVPGADTAPVPGEAGPAHGTIRPAPGQAELSRQVELGFMFGHSLASETSRQTLSAATAAFALADLLIEKGWIKEEEYQARREAVHTLLIEEAEWNGLGLFLNEEPKDKYAVTALPQINCADRVQLCGAACCLLRFPLSRQDVEEGVVRWDLGRPYWNLRCADGYCVHHDRAARRCQVYASRPAPCRLYDCQHDQRIWLDFDAMVVNPELTTVLANLTR